MGKSFSKNSTVPTYASAYNSTVPTYACDYNSTVPTYALDESMPYFRLIGRVGNPNITIRILGYAHSRTKTTAILLQLCKKSRNLVKNQRGAIEHETVLVLRTRMTDHILERPPVHYQVYPLPGGQARHQGKVGQTQGY